MAEPRGQAELADHPQRQVRPESRQLVLEGTHPLWLVVCHGCIANVADAGRCHHPGKALGLPKSLVDLRRGAVSFARRGPRS